MFLSQVAVSEEQLRRGEDTAVDQLFLDATPDGASFIRAHFPRSFVDVNREPYELDPRMFTSPLPGYANTRSLRVAGGLGSVPRIVGDNIELYRKKLPTEDALGRIECFHKPYHAALRHLLSRTQSIMGFSILLDCHSMPSLSVGNGKTSSADIVLGDRHGTSCSAALIHLFGYEARQLGYVTVQNTPYAGGYITEHYGQPQVQSHALQIEINRALYMDEKTLLLGKNFDRLKSDLATIIARINDLTEQDLSPIRNAAE